MDERKRVWLAERRNHITGTDLGAIMGYSKFASPMSVWLDKKGLVEPPVETQAMKMGLRLERTILGIYAEETGNCLNRAEPYELLCLENSVLAASLDARHSYGDLRPVDAKNIRVCNSAEWGESGSGDMPMRYMLQLYAQMMATGTNIASLAVLFSGQDFRIYTLEREEDIVSGILEFCARWWKTHIIDGIQPEADGSDATAAYIAQKLAKAEKGLIIKPTKEIEELAAAIKSAKKIIKETEEIQKEKENQLKLLVGDAEEVEGLLTWKNNKDSAKTDWKAIAMALASEEFIAEHTTLTTGARVLRFR